MSIYWLEKIFDKLSTIFPNGTMAAEVQTGVEGAQFADKIRKIDDAGTYIYIGYASPGTATSAANWRIERITGATGERLFAGGVITYTNIWDNRAALAYS